MEGPSGTASFKAGADAYARHVGRYTDGLARLFIDAIGVEPGQRALDIGCGPGAVTAALADTLGAEHVSAVDPTTHFVAACRELGHGSDVRKSAAERMPLDD